MALDSFSGGRSEYFDATKRCGLKYGGLVELIVNAVVDMPKPFMEWEQAEASIGS